MVKLNRTWLLTTLIALVLASLSCSALALSLGSTATPSPSPTLVRRPTNTRTATATRSPSPTTSFTPSDTPTPSNTWTFTPTSTSTPRPTRTNTPSRTPVPATFTPAPNQISRDYDAWQLTSVQLRPKISFLGTPITPQQYNRAPGSYLFLVLEFECLTGTSLIALFDLKEFGLTFVHRKDGYPHLWLQDQRQREFPVNIIATCWLAAPVPPDVQSVTFFYNGFIFRPTLPVVRVTE